MGTSQTTSPPLSLLEARTHHLRHQTHDSLPIAKNCPSLGKIISIASGKGGVGKTTIATHLSILASKEGKTFFFDGDLGMCNAHLVLGINPPQDMIDHLKQRISIRQVIQKVRKNLDFSGGGWAGKGAQLSNHILASSLSREINILRKDYKYLFVDCSAGIGASVRNFTHISDYLLIVANSTSSSLLDAYGLIKTMHKEEFKGKIGLISNQCNSLIEGRQIHNQLNQCSERFLGRTIHHYGTIRKDLKLDQALYRRQPLMDWAPQAKATKNFINLWNNLSEEMEP